MFGFHPPCPASTASSSRATMLVILIIGFTAGPDVSLYGSPTVSPVTAALWASDPLPPKWPSSIYFLALSQAPPPAVIEMATNRPVTITPRRSEHVNGAAIVRPVRALHDAGLLAELAADLFDHRLGGAADGQHRHAA